MELREENRSLQERVDELETKLTAAIPANLEAAEGSELAGAREENEALREQIRTGQLKPGDQLPTIAELAEEGRLRAHIDATFPLAEAAKAHAYGETGRTTGKLVIDPQR